MGDLAAITEPRIRTRSYEIEDEGLFRRDEHSDEDEVRPWLLAPESAIEIGAGLPESYNFV